MHRFSPSSIQQVIRWCSTAQSRPSSSFHLHKITSATIATQHQPTSVPFGIVAALTRNNVIGINGKLPWKDLPQDREHFVNLTRNKILIVGRRTFAEEDPTGAHINHVRMCIVVSRTMKASDLVVANSRDTSSNRSDDVKLPKVILARSFDEALELASYELIRNDRQVKSYYEDATTTTEQKLEKNSSSNSTIHCWVGGGERIYQEALEHGNAKEVHLTHVNIDVDLSSDNENEHIAYFPMECLRKNGFELVSSSTAGAKGSLNFLCNFCVYKKGSAVGMKVDEDRRL